MEQLRELSRKEQKLYDEWLVEKEAVDHFRENFDKEGFVDNGLQNGPSHELQDSLQLQPLWG